MRYFFSSFNYLELSEQAQEELEVVPEEHLEDVAVEEEVEEVEEEVEVVEVVEVDLVDQ